MHDFIRAPKDGKRKIPSARLSGNTDSTSPQKTIQLGVTALSVPASMRSKVGQDGDVLEATVPHWVVRSQHQMEEVVQNAISNRASFLDCLNMFSYSDKISHPEESSLATLFPGTETTRN